MIIQPTLTTTEPVITVKEARKLMGKDAEKLSDMELSEMISSFDLIATIQFDLFPKT